MKRSFMFFMACTCGIAVANIYYIQPLIVTIANHFNISIVKVGDASSIIQLSYALGLILFVPLADKFPRKGLIISLLSFNCLSQMFAATSANFNQFLVANFLIGITSVTAQIIIPAISIISSSDEKGKNVASVMSGLFSGILLARTFSGYIGHRYSWEYVYWSSCVLDALLILINLRVFPEIPGKTKSSYGTLMCSIAEMLFKCKELQKASIYGLLGFSGYSALWGSLAYLLSKPPYLYNSSIVGLFGLAGLSGIIFSKYIGILSDRFGYNRIINLGGITSFIAYLLIAFSEKNLGFLIIGIIILDFGGRSNLLGNQLSLFHLGENIRSRLNTVFMSIYFIGGAMGTWIGITITELYGWHGISIFGLVISSFILLTNAFPSLCHAMNR